MFNNRFDDSNQFPQDLPSLGNIANSLLFINTVNGISNNSLIMGITPQ